MCLSICQVMSQPGSRRGLWGTLIIPRIVLLRASTMQVLRLQHGPKVGLLCDNLHLCWLFQIGSLHLLTRRKGKPHFRLSTWGAIALEGEANFVSKLCCEVLQHRVNHAHTISSTLIKPSLHELCMPQQILMSKLSYLSTRTEDQTPL